MTAAAAGSSHAAAPVVPDYLMHARCFAACMLAGVESGPAGPHSMWAADSCSHLQQAHAATHEALVAASAAGAVGAAVHELMLYSLVDGGALRVERHEGQEPVLRLDVHGLESAATHMAVSACT